MADRVIAKFAAPRMLLLLALLFALAQFGGMAPALRLAAAGSNEEERQEEERPEAEQEGAQLERRPAVPRADGLVSPAQTFSAAQRRLLSYDRNAATAPAEHELRNGTGTPLVC